MALAFLNFTRPEPIKLLRTLMIEWGYASQRVGNVLLGPWVKAQTAQPPASLGKPFHPGS